MYNQINKQTNQKNAGGISSVNQLVYKNEFFKIL